MPLADVGVERVWLLELDGISTGVVSSESAAFGDGAFGEYAFGEDPLADTGGVEKLLYATRGYISHSADSPASRYYDGRVLDVHVIRRMMDRNEGLGGLAYCFAEVLLVNAGELDQLPDQYFFDGRGAKLLIGMPGAARSTFDVVFTGFTRNVQVTNRDLRVSMSDSNVRLELPINRTTYAGTGGLEGGADLKGKPKPKAWGASHNVPCPLVDSTLLIYQVHDGSLNDVPAVYDRQVSLTKGSDYASLSDLLATAPSAGQYRVYKAGGYFRLGSTPAGTCTADVLGDNTGGYINKTGEIVNRILLTQALFEAGDIDAGSFTTLNTDAAAETGIWTGTEVASIGTVIDFLLAGIGAFGGFTRTGLFTVGVITAPSGAPAATFNDSHIKSLGREPLPNAVDPIVWQTRVAWQHNYTVMTDVASSVTAARRTFAAQEDRFAVRDDTTTRSRRTLAREYGPTGNRYAQAADADAEAVRLQTLWGTQRKLYSVTLPVEALTVDLLNAVSLTHARYGLAGGVLARVLWHEVRNAVVTIKAFV